MSMIQQGKKPFLWICVIVLLCVVVVWQTSSSVTYQFAFNAPKPVGLSTFGPVPHSLVGGNCEKETECRIKDLHQRITHVCLADKKVRHDLSKRIYTGFLNHEHKLLYFSIPKVGCSFWKRIFKVLNSKNANKSMFDIPNYKAHFGDGLIRAKTRAEMDKYLPTYTSFLFVRDPFSRLFSGFIDKMFVPNPIALNHGHMFFRQYRPDEDPEDDCPNNISFGDFAMYVADRISSNKMPDDHFKAMWRHFNPCDVNLTYIAKMEHFMDDTNYILSSAGVSLEEVSGTNDDGNFDEMHEKGYMEDIINRTFKFIKKKKPCISPRKVLQRLWSTFYIRGYLSISQRMPNFKHPEKITAIEFVRATSIAYDLSGTKSERSIQRKEAMMEAFSTVPRKTLYKLAGAFDMDCRVFDYDCNVDVRFPVRNSTQLFYFKNTWS